MKKISQLGFTLIEIIIVIAILGILAVGILAALDPLEQIKKAQDSTTREITTQVYDAELRYYAIKQAFTWAPAATFGGTTGVLLNSATGTTQVNLLVTAGELRTDFVSSAGTKLGQIYIRSAAAGTLSLCFRPTSKMIQRDPNAKFTSGGGAGTGCMSFTPPGTTACYWCIK